MALAAGTRLGPYEILAPIGAGGMGEVYRARDSRLDRDVAVKILPQHLSQNPELLERFVRETKALAALSHPNLLIIFDTGAASGISYAVTELLDGESLRARLGRGPIFWRKAVEIGAALAEGISAAHSKNITHRDLKPDNIFLTADSRVKVLDFGLAKIEESQVSTADAQTGMEIRTHPGMVVGSPGYMSPEQIRGASAGPASDIFSLGCVLYEIVSGERAFPAQTAVESMTAILRDNPRGLTAMGVDVPSELDRLIAHCLEKNPQRRFQAASDLAFRLRELLGSHSAAATTSRTIDSIAVLPFSNASRDPDTEYLCDGITESILNRLAQIPRLRVTPRSIVFRYKSSDADPRSVGQELNVRAVLTGRVMHRGEALVVGAELMDVVAGTQLWGERYNRKIADIFELEEEIAHKISEGLRVKLSGEEKSRLLKRFTESTEAYQLYLRGRYHWTRRTPEHVKKGVEAFQKAIEKDPEYALAYSGLADCFSLMAIHSVLPPREAYARAKAAAVAAVTFDDELAEGHVSLGFIRAYCDWDWAAAELEFQRAVELNSSNWATPYWYGMILTSLGRFEEAERQIAKGLELEPQSPIVIHGAAMNSIAATRYGEAIERCKNGLAVAPDYFLLRLWMGVALQMEQRYAEAIEEIEKAVELSDGSLSFVAGALANALGSAGRKEEAERMLRNLMEHAERGTADSLDVALAYAGLGQNERALEWIEKACNSHGGSLPVMIKVDPRLAALRGEPRFQKVIARMRLGA